MTVPLRTRILLADDHAMVRRGLRMVLEAEPDMIVVGEADDGAEAVELALSTEADLAVLVAAVRAAVRGEPFLYPAAVSALIRDYLDRASHGEETPSDPLTTGELEIVKLIAEGHTTDEIASTLVISKRTVEHHRSHILEKLGMRDRVELARYAIRRGLVEP